MMECKSALSDAQGDMEAAAVILRKRGLAQAARRTGRAASEGLVGGWTAEDGGVGALVEVNCESDFVARTDDFRALVAELAAQVAAVDPPAEGWLDQPLQGGGGRTVRQRVAETAAKLGENIAATRFVRFAARDGLVGLYLHLGGKIGVLVEIAGDGAAARPEARTLAKELAMQVAAATPAYVARQDAPADVIEREKSIFRAQVEGAGKKPEVVERIVEGKLGGFFEQTVLLEQPSIRDPKMKVAQLVDVASASIGAPVRVQRFVRFKVGERS
jgi:elongation factor Ts